VISDLERARPRAGVTIRYCPLANCSKRKHGIGRNISGGLATVCNFLFHMNNNFKVKGQVSAVVKKTAVSIELKSSSPYSQKPAIGP
jgi:hypothetical protein